MVAQHERMAADAAAVGLDFQWQTLRGGNSYDAHRLIHLARALGREDEVTERVMRAWYTEGEAIGDPETLVRLGVEAGLDEAVVRDLLAGDDHGIDVRTDLALASQIGITSVPTFVLDQKYGVSGAQPVEVMLNAIRQVWDLQGTEPEPVASGGGCGGGCCGGACGSGGAETAEATTDGCRSRLRCRRLRRSLRAGDAEREPSAPLAERGRRVRVRGHPAYLEEPTCPCCIPALGEFSGVPPRGVPGTILGGRAASREIGPAGDGDVGPASTGRGSAAQEPDRRQVGEGRQQECARDGEHDTQGEPASPLHRPATPGGCTVPSGS